MSRMGLSLIALLGALALGACSVQGVSRYQNATNMGCTPSPVGGVNCSG